MGFSIGGMNLVKAYQGYSIYRWKYSTGLKKKGLQKEGKSWIMQKEKDLNSDQKQR